MKLCTITIAAALIGVGCSQKTVPMGTERGPCRDNGICDEGLVCLSDLCVAPPPADCEAVARKLGFMVLGNYAKQSERDAYVSKMVTTCKQEKLTKEEADCILEAKNRAALGRCPRPLAMGSCAKVIAHVNKILTGSDPALSDFLDSKPALDRCERRGVTKREEECVLRATNKQQLEACGRF